MSKVIHIRDLNLEGLKSELINNLEESYDDNDNLIFPLEIPKNVIEEFNKRIINPKNINNIIKMCDYLMIEDTLNFLINNSEPTDEKYIIDNYQLSGKPKFILPKFMTEGKWIKEKELTFLNKQEFDRFLIENNFLSYHHYIKDFDNYLEEVVSHGLTNWFEFYKNNHNNEYNKISKLTYSSIAAYFNKKDCLIYLNENNISKYGRNTMTFAILGGNLDIIKLIYNKKFNYIRNNNYDILAAAAFNGSLENLKYVHKNILKDINYFSLNESARKGHLDCMKYLVDNGAGFTIESYANKIIYFPDDKPIYACMHACVSGSLECFRFAYENGCPLQHSLQTAARYGAFEIIKYINENDLRSKDKSTNYKIILASICFGSVEIYKYLYEVMEIKDYPKNISMIGSMRNTDILKYMCETENITLTSRHLLDAIRSNNSIECIEYILNHFIHTNNNYACYPNSAFSNGNFRMCKMLLERFPEATKDLWIPYYCENYDIWNYLIDNGVKFKKLKFELFCDYYNETRWFNKWENIFILEKTKILWDSKLTNILGFFGCYDYLKYVLEKGCKTDDKLICYICKDYNPQVLNLRFNYYTIFNPDKLKCLKYVFENNYFDFTKNDFIDDVIKVCGDLNIILYLKEKGFIKQKESITFDIYNWF